MRAETHDYAPICGCICQHAVNAWSNDNHFLRQNENILPHPATASRLSPSCQYRLDTFEPLAVGNSGGKTARVDGARSELHHLPEVRNNSPPWWNWPYF